MRNILAHKRTSGGRQTEEEKRIELKEGRRGRKAGGGGLRLSPRDVRRELRHVLGEGRALGHEGLFAVVVGKEGEEGVIERLVDGDALLGAPFQ